MRRYVLKLWRSIAEYELSGIVSEAVVGHVHALVVSIEGVEALRQQLHLEALVREQHPRQAQIRGRVIGAGEAVAGEPREAIAIGVGIPVRIPEDARVQRTSAAGGYQPGKLPVVEDGLQCSVLAVKWPRLSYPREHQPL